MQGPCKPRVTEWTGFQPFDEQHSLLSQAVELFLRDRMHGEGDTMRHLASKGFRVYYDQDPRKEYDYGVQTLAVDLRNGLRLSKLIELLTGMPSKGYRDLHVMTSLTVSKPSSLGGGQVQISCS